MKSTKKRLEMKYYLAIDIGASSGRHIVAWKDENGVLQSEEMYRFPNGVNNVDGHLYWDVDRLFNEVKVGIKKVLEKYPTVESMSIDTWGVDYVLMNGDESIYPVFAYRDSRTKKVIPEVHKIIPFERLYEITGCQFQEFNTIYQLYEDKVSGKLDKADGFLMIPEYLMHRLTGIKKKEYTNAGTMGLYDAKTLTPSKEIIDLLGLPNFLFDPVYKPGTTVGDFSPEVQKEVNGNIKVVLCPTHDTAAAVEGIPMDINSPYISSGTWSLLGIKNDVAITNKEGYESNYSNEYGPDYIRVQKNIMGLWIIQCLAKQLNMDFPTMVKQSMESSYKEIYDVNDERFLSPKDMKQEIAAYFKEKGLPTPVDDKDYINATYHSLAYSYKVAFEELEKVTGKKYTSLYIVGGGAKNKYLNDLTKHYLQKEVIALPIEATALGNLKTQMEAK